MLLLILVVIRLRKFYKERNPQLKEYKTVYAVTLLNIKKYLNDRDFYEVAEDIDW